MQSIEFDDRDDDVGSVQEPMRATRQVTAGMEVEVCFPHLKPNVRWIQAIIESVDPGTGTGALSSSQFHTICTYF